ncbi:MAG: ABC transporter permease [Burkholderiales bacterium]|nr:ABC transporter permease [Burkholderiales bacterium]
MNTPLHTNAGNFWTRLWALTIKEFRQLLRDKSNLAIGILLPALLILLFGYGISLDLKNATVAVVIEDASPTAADVLSGLDLSRYLTPMPVRSMREAEALMQSRKADAILRIPGDFSAQLNRGQAKLQLIVHGADASTARTVQGYVGGAIAQWGVRQRDSAGQALSGAAKATRAMYGNVTLEQRMWFNAANTSTWYLVPGLIVLIMTLVGAFLTSMVVAREWERGTLEALFVTPVRPLEILLAKMIPYFVVGMIGFVMCLLASRFLFEVPMQGSLLLLVLSSVLYMFVALGVGLLISSVTKNQFIASQVALLTSFLPALMLSGFLFDLNNVPVVVRFVGNLLPATHFLELIKTLMLAGNVWPLIAKNLLILAAYAVFFLGAAQRVTKKIIA